MLFFYQDKQQCMDVVVVEFCDKLEFNECEDDEYRCVNGMCIPGEYDCMDWSDEMEISIENGKNCILSPNVDCDEHLCFYDKYSCGDGQCIHSTVVIFCAIIIVK